MVGPEQESERYQEQSSGTGSASDTVAKDISTQGQRRARDFKGWITTIAAVSSACAAVASAITAKEVFDISKLQLRQEIERTSFSTIVLDKDSWSIRLVQVSGKEIPLSAVGLAPTFLDAKGVPYTGNLFSKSVSRSDETDAHAYDIRNARSEICRQPNVPDPCPRIFSIEIHYSVLGEIMRTTVR